MANVNAEATRLPPSPAAPVALAAGLLGLAGVVLGAFGAHALKARLTANSMAEVWETAVHFHLFHAVALLALAAWIEARSARQAVPALIPRGERLLVWAARCWIAGILLFSGSLYGLALGAPKWLGPVTPLGGLALMAGWTLCALAGWRAR